MNNPFRNEVGSKWLKQKWTSEIALIFWRKSQLCSVEQSHSTSKVKMVCLSILYKESKCRFRAHFLLNNLSKPLNIADFGTKHWSHYSNPHYLRLLLEAMQGRQSIGGRGDCPLPQFFRKFASFSLKSYENTTNYNTLPSRFLVFDKLPPPDFESFRQAW